MRGESNVWLQRCKVTTQLVGSRPTIYCGRKLKNPNQDGTLQVRSHITNQIPVSYPWITAATTLKKIPNQEETLQIRSHITSRTPVSLLLGGIGYCTKGQSNSNRTEKCGEWKRWQLKAPFAQLGPNTTHLCNYTKRRKQTSIGSRTRNGQ